MGSRGFSEFHRYFVSEFDREGLIVDVRWNGGGNVSQLLLEKLRRRRIGYDANRWAVPESYPSEAPMGPMVALTNEYAGSDGDIFSHSFKLYGLGPLIGKRTWGGVIGIWPRHFLVDGTLTTQPEFAFWFEDVGWNVENYGTDPDIEVDVLPQDYVRGADPQLDRALSEIQRLIRKLRPSILSFKNKPRRGFKRLPKAP
jgi:tricorn protease